MDGAEVVVCFSFGIEVLLLLFFCHIDILDEASKFVSPLFACFLFSGMVRIGDECPAGFAFTEEKLYHDVFFGGARRDGLPGGGAWCGNLLGGEMCNCCKGVDLTYGRSGVMDVEVGKGGVAGATIEASTRKR